MATRLGTPLDAPSGVQPTIYFDPSNAGTNNLDATNGGVASRTDVRGPGYPVSTSVSIPRPGYATGASGINGKNAISYGGGKRDVAPLSITGKSLTAFVVIQPQGSSGYARFLSLGVNEQTEYDRTSSIIVAQDNNSQNFRIFYNSPALAGFNDVPFTDNVPFILELVCDGTNARLYKDGTLVDTGSQTAAFAIEQWSFGTSQQNGDPFSGLQGSQLAYSSALSVADRQWLEGCLAWQWGTQGALPANHPFKAAPPSVTTGGSDATATGATLSTAGALIAGSATGTTNATASGATLSAAASLVPGTAAGTTNATASGAILTAPGALVPGSASASASGSVTATGATVPVSAALVPGSASATANVTAPGALLSSSIIYFPATATGASNGTAAGVTLSAGPILLPGAATAGRGATAIGATFTAAMTFVPGAASATENPYPPITPSVLLSGTLLGPVSLQARLQANTITLQARLRR